MPYMTPNNELALLTDMCTLVRENQRKEGSALTLHEQHLEAILKAASLVLEEGEEGDESSVLNRCYFSVDEFTKVALLEYPTNRQLWREVPDQIRTAVARELVSAADASRKGAGVVGSVLSTPDCLENGQAAGLYGKPRGTGPRPGLEQLRSTSQACSETQAAVHPRRGCAHQI